MIGKTTIRHLGLFFAILISTFFLVNWLSHKPSCAGNFCYNPTTVSDFEDVINSPIPKDYSGTYDTPIIWRDCTDLYPISLFPEEFFDGLEEIDWSIRYTVVSLKGFRLGYLFCFHNPDTNGEYYGFNLIEYPTMREYTYSEDGIYVAKYFESIIYPQDKPELIMRRFHFPQIRLFLR